MKLKIAIHILCHVMAFTDAYTTRKDISLGAFERNPIAAPFVHNNSLYITSQIEPTLYDISDKLLKNHPKAQKIINVMCTGSTVVHLGATVNNVVEERKYNAYLLGK